MAISKLKRSYPQIVRKVQENLNYVDYDYRGRIENNNIRISGATPILNAYKMWLQSGRGDYIRNYGFGGFFALNLNEYEFSPASENQIKADLIAKTRELFPEINLIGVEVKCMAPKRYWKVKVSVQDNLTGLVAIDMITKEESIVFDK